MSPVCGSKSLTLLIVTTYTVDECGVSLSLAQATCSEVIDFALGDLWTMESDQMDWNLSTFRLLQLRSNRAILLALFSLLILPIHSLHGAVEATTFTDLAQRAEKAKNDKQLDRAIGLYRAALTRRQSWVEGWWDLATIQYKLQRFSDARDSFHHVTLLNPKSGAAFALMGLCDFELGAYSTAMKYLDLGGKLGTGDSEELTPLILFHVALIFTRQGEFDLSNSQLQMFVASGNHSPELVEALGLNALRLPLVPAQIPTAKCELVNKAGEASWQFNAHNVEDAKILYGRLATEYPNEPNVHYAYATYLLDSDPSFAFEEFKKELEINPKNSAARLQVAFFDLQQGEPEKAMELAQSMFRILPKDYRVHLVMGRGYLQLDQSARAIEELKTSMQLAPRDSETHFYLAQAYRRIGNKNAAKLQQAEFDRLNKETNQQTSAAGWWYFAGQYYKKKRYAEARDALRRVTEQNPKDGPAWGMMGLCEFELKDYQNALEHLKKAKENGLVNAPELESPLHYYLAILLDSQGQFDNGLQELEHIASKPDDEQKIAEALGINAFRMKVRPSEVSADIHDRVLEAGQASRAMILGHLEEAKGKFASLASEFPNEPNVHYIYGICLAHLNDWSGAIDQFQEELRISPAHADALSQIVLIHLREGQREVALKEAEVAVKMDPDDFLPHNVFGWALLADHSFDRAAGEMAESVRLAPDSPVTHYGLALAYKAAGKTAQAQDEMSKSSVLSLK